MDLTSNVSLEDMISDLSYRFHYRSAASVTKSAIGRRPGKEPPDLISFLAVAYLHAFDIGDMYWEIPRGPLGAGATAQVNQSLEDVQWSLAFKRPTSVETLGGKNAEKYEILMSEIKVLSHAAMRYHPHIVTLEAICWEFHPVTDEVWPVLVFEKAQEGDLETFMSSDKGRALDFKQRLQICQDIAVGLVHLHRHAIVHGDIKPRNILVFSEQGNYYAKLSDFGYSALMARDETIEIAKTRPWNAPETDSLWYFNFEDARKTDIYSFGILCVWTLFQNNDHDPTVLGEGPIGTCYHWITQLRREEGILGFSVGQLNSVINLDSAHRSNLEHFFKLAMAPESTHRDLCLLGLFNDHSTQGDRIDCEKFGCVQTRPKTEFFVPDHLPYAAQFQLRKIWYPIWRSDFRLWKAIVKALEIQANYADDERCRSNAAFQLALCYNFGFGTPKCETTKDQWLEKSGRKVNDLMSENMIIAEGIDDSGKWRQGVVGKFSTMSLAEVYEKSGKLTAAEEAHRQAITDLSDTVLLRSHPTIVALKVELAGILLTQRRSSESETLLLETLAPLEKHGRLSQPILSGLIKAYYSLGRYKDVDTAIQKKMSLAKESASVPFYPAGYRRNDITSEGFLLSALSSSYLDQGRFEEAERLILRRVVMTHTEYGEAHEATLYAVSDLARIHNEAMRPAEAREILHYVLPLAQRSMGEDHYVVLLLRMRLSQAYSSRKEQKAAEIVAVRNLEACKRVLGETHLMTASQSEVLAMNLRKQGRDNEALGLFENVLKIRRLFQGELHDGTAYSMSRLSDCLLDLQRWEECELLRVRALQILSQTMGEKHKNTIYLSNCLTSIRKSLRARAWWARVVPVKVIMGFDWLIVRFQSWVDRLRYRYA